MKTKKELKIVIKHLNKLIEEKEKQPHNYFTWEDKYHVEKVKEYFENKLKEELIDSRKQSL